MGRLAKMIGRGDTGRALAAELYTRHGVRTRADLRKAEILRLLPRESRANVLYNPMKNIPLATAQEIVRELKRRLEFCWSPSGSSDQCQRFEIVPVGSMRREAARLKDMDMLLVVPDDYSEEKLKQVTAGARLRPKGPSDRLELKDFYAGGAHRLSFILERVPHQRDDGKKKHYRTDIFLTTVTELPFAMFHYTGSRQYNIRTRAYAKRKGWLLNQYGIFNARTGHRLPGTSGIRTEKDLAEFLGVTYRLPTDREK